MYKMYRVRHGKKCYKVKAECEEAAVAKLRIYLENDLSIFDKDVHDGIGDIAQFLGGIAVNILEKKKLLQSKDPSILESSMKALGVIGVDLIGIGAEITNIVNKNADRR